MNEILKCGAATMEKLSGKCGLERIVEKTQDEGKEKHVPVIEKTKAGIKVKIGSVPHPMEEGHHIEWIEVIAGYMVYRKHLNAGDAPEAEFHVSEDKVDMAREHCNIHGLWKS